MMVFTVDLGNQADYTAYSVIEAKEIYEPDTHEGIDRKAKEARYKYTIRYLKRVGLGTSYPGIARDVKQKLENPKIKGAELVVDGTGVGLPVLQEMREIGLDPIGICITGGETVGTWKSPSGSRLGYTVPKQNIVTVIQSALSARRLAIPQGLDNLNDFKKELMNFKVSLTKKGNEVFGASDDAIHDDLVMSVGIGIWYLFYRYGITKKVISENLDILGKQIKKRGDDYSPFTTL